MVADNPTWNIYVLKNPLSQEVLYVGRTKNPKVRLSAHLSDAVKLNRHNTRKNNRLRKMIAAGIMPVLEIVESGTGDSADAERRWIAQLRAQGVDLLNGTDGGEGVCGPRGPQSPEHRANLREALKNAVRGVPGREYRARISAGVKAFYKQNPERHLRTSQHLKRLGIARIGKRLADETCARISAGLKAFHSGTGAGTIHYVMNRQREAISRADLIRLGYGTLRSPVVGKDEYVVVFHLDSFELAEWSVAKRRMDITVWNLCRPRQSLLRTFSAYGIM